MPIGVLIVDDHEIVREGLSRVLSEEADFRVVGLAASGEEALGLAERLDPDVVLLDLVMPGLDGIETLRRMRAARPHIQVVVLTSFSEDRQVRQAVEAGALGYLLKDVLRPELVRAIRNAAAGRPTLHPEAQRHLMRRVRSEAADDPLLKLTTREREVLALIGRGLANKDIGKHLGLTHGTVKGYVSGILSKLGLEHRTQAALLAARLGLTPVSADEPHDV